jgi:hypothetical protein
MNDQLRALAKRYERNPVLRGLLQLLPYAVGAAFDAALQAVLSNYEATRLEGFFEELQSANVQLSPDLIRNDDFLHCYFATIRAVTRSRRRQKARYLARLLSASFNGDEISSVDEYDDLLGIVDELSYRELLVLSILSKHEHATPHASSENDLQHSNRFWKPFLQEVTERAGLSPDLIDGFLIRLARTGCYELFTGYASGPIGGHGKLTALYYRLEDIAGSFGGVAA